MIAAWTSEAEVLMAARRHADPLTDLELLHIREKMAMEDARRFAESCGITIAATPDGQALYVGGAVPEVLVPALTDAVDQSAPASEPHREPPALATCRDILGAACGQLSLSAGPVYLIEPHVRFDTPARIVRSDTPPAERPPLVNPGNWGHGEWDDLLAGTLGPWAMAVVDGRVASIAHTPGPLSARAAEVGVWTDPDFRGRGYAAAVTAAWADLLRPSRRYLFYSTAADNASSQRVATRLRLRPLGWTWSLHRADPGHQDARHPLSRRGH